MWLGFRHQRPLLIEGGLAVRAYSSSQSSRCSPSLHSEHDILEFVLHLGATGLRVASGGCYRRGSLPGHMAQSNRHLFQGKARGSQPMAEVVSEIVKGDVSDLFPLLPRCPLLDGAPPGMQPSLGKTPGMITNTVGHFVGAL